MSSLVTCPICNKSVPEWYVSDHMDRECQGAPASAEPPSCPPSAKRAGGPQSPGRALKAPALEPTPSAAAEPRPEGPTLPTGSAMESGHRSGSASLSDDMEAKRRLHNTRLPLAERLRPLSLAQFVGQRGLVGPQGILRALIEGDRIPSMIFWGGPGLGKTTLARIIARRSSSVFKELSAVSQNTADVKRVIEDAGNLNRLAGKRTILFLDEIHRFNKAQQDVFLPYVERGQIILIGATTENPSFRLNGALLSRCRVFKLDPLSGSEIAYIASQACRLKQEDAGQIPTGLAAVIADYIASVSNGDARTAINIVEIAMSSRADGQALDLGSVQQALQRTHVVYGEDEHYDLISALHKSVRGSDANAALYWLGRMLQGGDDPLYIARRMVRMASEDIGLADNHALPLAMSALQACQVIGMPECDTILAHCAAYLARAPKSVESYQAFNRVKAVIASENPWPVPLHIRNAPTGLMKNMGYAKGYKYNPDFDGPVDQEYLPEQIKHYDFFKDPN
ncbi:DNA-dependent ATPase mgs1 [Coemansia sp. RSA 552]|nr:DNA-dependent ATPase mgs1 [Coemansia sp. RSA 552]